jgi:hypothetical protein
LRTGAGSVIAPGLEAFELIPSEAVFEDRFCAASSARECTGLPVGKPISCKIETNILLMV